MKHCSKNSSIRKYRTLAIIGNGFDLAHGYNTRYDQFVNATDSPTLDAFKAECDADENAATWYHFEENINRLTSSYFQKSMSGDYEYEDVLRHRDQLHSIFRDIHELLIKYLQNEVSKHPVRKRSSVKKFLKRKTYALSFNYTDVADHYSCTVYHVHGTLAEHDILLGYDYRDEPCLEEYDDMRWSKRLCRESLMFRRHLKNSLHLHPDDEIFQELMRSLEAYQHSENAGRGIDDEIESLIPYFHQIDSFLRGVRNGKPIPDVLLSRITTLVVMGHGIEADQVYLKDILRRCHHLKKVVIFRYAGESNVSFDAKAAFFRPYCKRIRSQEY